MAKHNQISNPNFLSAEAIAKMCDKSCLKGDEYFACCPHHDDKTPSLSIKNAESVTLIHCHAGCDPASICNALKIDQSQLFRYQTQRKNDAGKNFHDAIVRNFPVKWRETSRWGYENNRGETCEVVRRDHPVEGKKIRVEPSGIDGPWLPLIQRPHEESEGEPDLSDALIIVEGEKCLGRIICTGLHGCCWKGGANSWRQTVWANLPLKRVILWPDFDAQGLKCMNELGAHLQSLDYKVEIVPVEKLMQQNTDVADISTHEIVPILEKTIPFVAAKTAGDWRQGHEILKSNNSPFIGTFDDIKIQNTEWLIPRWFQTGGLHVLAGKPGTGKSRVAIDLAARLSIGKYKWDGHIVPQCKTIYHSTEMSYREEAGQQIACFGESGAKRDMIQLIDPTVNLVDFIEANLPSFLKQNPEYKFMIFDTGLDVIGANENNSATIVRKALTGVQLMCRKYETTALLIVHRSKEVRDDPLDTILGSMQWGAVPRGTLIACQGTTEQAPFRLVRGKYSNAPTGGGLEYRVVKATRGEIKGTSIQWESESLQGSPAALLTGKNTGRGFECEEDILHILSCGDVWHARKLIVEELDEGDFAPATIDRALGSLSKKGKITKGDKRRNLYGKYCSVARINEN